MIHGKRVIVVMPAYNASQTLVDTYNDIPMDIVDDVVLVDDLSSDNTAALAERIGIRHVIRHERNLGYGGNQKTCYRTALDLGADIVIMVHPDYQYTPLLIPSMAHLLASGLFDAVLGSRILGKGALRGGMPTYKYVANRILTFVQNLLIDEKLSEYHTGYRAFTREVLESINYTANSDNFVFDNQMLSQIVYAGFSIGEITCPTKYFEDASSISFRRSVTYGFGVLRVSASHFLQRTGLASFDLYKSPER